jgi:outer membrane immunogenic protein
MNRDLLEAAIAFVSVMVAAPVIADEAPETKPVRHVRQVERVAAPARAAPASAQPSWSGAQVGGQGGVTSMAQGFAEPGAHLYPTGEFCGNGALCSETPFSFSGNKTSVTGGGFLGYRMQFGPAVVGVEGDINAKSGSNSYAYTDSNIFRVENFNGTVKQGADGSIRGRAGFLVTPWALAYVTGGIGFGSVSGSFGYTARELASFDGACCSSVTGGGSWSATRSGATGGAGIEALITSVWTLRLEYRYTDLGRFSENGERLSQHGLPPGRLRVPLQQRADQPASDLPNREARNRI